MKPPPRKRTKRDLDLKPAVTQRPGKVLCAWQHVEQRRLLSALKRLSRSAGGDGDIDYAFLKKYVPSRSISEIHSAVEALKNKVVSGAHFRLKQRRWEEKKVRKPIEVWAHLASDMAGTLEGAISTAFSQMLIVSSVEPCTLMNCDPPQIHRTPTDKGRSVGRTVPLRPVPRSPRQGERPSSSPARPLQVPATGTVVRVPNSKLNQPQRQLSATVGALPAAPSCQPGAAKILSAPFTPPQPASQTVTPAAGQVGLSSRFAAVGKTQSDFSSVIQATQQPSDQHPITTSPNSSPKPALSSPQTPRASSASSPVTSTNPSAATFSSSATSSCSSSLSTPPLSSPPPCTPPLSTPSLSMPPPSTPPLSAPPPSTPPLSTSTAAFRARFGRTSKHATADSPRTLGVKSVVDFERIYRYLGVILKPNEKCHLTPMESAIVLDLLMSLPEELPLLDCNKLHEHLIEIYRSLSSPADSKAARGMFEDLMKGQNAHTETPSGQDSNSTNSNISDRGGKNLQPHDAESRSSENNNTCSQSGAADTRSCPPLNPFMVPLKLLMRR